jgi:hypothetical protein
MRSIRVVLLLSAIPAGFADSAAGIQWTPPSAWKAQGQRPMRAATYTVPAAAGDKEDGECAVFYFGPGQGGGVEDNIKRWEGQFPSIEKGPTRRKQTIAGFNVTLLDLSGTYAMSSGPMMAAKANKPGYRLLGAIVEAPQGNVFFKFTAPAKTVAAHEAAFQGLLKSIRK